MKTKNKKETRGGKRPLSGRKKADYQTKTIAFRVRLQWVKVIKSMVKAKVSELSQNCSQRTGLGEGLEFGSRQPVTEAKFINKS